MRAISFFLKDTTGATAVEYAVMLGLVLMGAWVAIMSFGVSTQELWSDINTQASGAMNSAGG